jgi:hypothetical protein
MGADGLPEMTSPPTATRSSAAAERMRAHRQRRRDGLRCLTIELRESEIDALVGKTADARNAADAIRDALYALLERVIP